MKKIGKQVHQIVCTPTHLRNGESTFIRLKNGDILHAFTCYGSQGNGDECHSEIAGCISADEGETWGSASVMFSMDEGAQNNMSPSLFRMTDGRLGMIYLRKHYDERNVLFCNPVFRFSTDEGRTWSDYRFISENRGYYCTVNDSVIVQKNGRILSATAKSSDGNETFQARVVFMYSDDCGETWSELPAVLTDPFPDGHGLEEPCVYEHENGDLWVLCRTALGHQYQAYSTDGGATWTKVIPNCFFTGPDSPMRVRRVGKYTAAVFNPVPFCCVSDAVECWGSPKRTPLTVTFDEQDGRQMNKPGISHLDGGLKGLQARTFLLEDDPANSFCYPAVIDVKDGFLVSYYYSGGTDMCLHDTIIKKVYYSEFEDI